VCAGSRGGFLVGVQLRDGGGGLDDDGPVVEHHAARLARLEVHVALAVFVPALGVGEVLVPGHSAEAVLDRAEQHVDVEQTRQVGIAGEVLPELLH
jgi:hypothetical protein